MHAPVNPAIPTQNQKAKSLQTKSLQTAMQTPRKPACMHGHIAIVDGEDQFYRPVSRTKIAGRGGNRSLL